MRWIGRVLHEIQRLQKYADRPWYLPALALVSLADLFLVFFPVDGIVVVSAMNQPKRWVTLGLVMGLGSALGGLLLAAVSQAYGLEFVEWLSPGISEGKTWQRSERWLESLGPWLLFLLGASPLAQQPALMVAGLTDMTLPLIGVAMGSGRVLKFLAYAWASSHAPRLLKKVPFLRGELEEVSAPKIDKEKGSRP